MEKKYYAVVADEKNNGHWLGRFSNQMLADTAARERNGKLYEYDQPLGNGDDHRKGKLIADYSGTTKI